MNDMMIDVFLYGRNVGLLEWNARRGIAEFQYYPQFLRDGWEVAPIVMPVGRSTRDRVYRY